MSASTPTKLATLLFVVNVRQEHPSTHVLEVLLEAEIVGFGFPDPLERLDQDVAVNEQAKPEHGPYFHPHLTNW